MFTREMEKTFKEYKQFSVIAVLGPRQSGKTTLVQAVFANHVFVSLENPRDREFAIN